MRNAFLFLLPWICLSIAACSTTAERVYGPPPQSPAYPAKLVWANKLSEIGPDRFARLSPGVSGKAVIVADIEGKLTAYTQTMGELLWQKQYNTIFSAGPNVVNHIALLGNKDAEVYAVDASTGDLLWSQRISSEILAPPQLRNDRVIAQTNDGKIFGLRADNGKIIWVYDRNVPILSLRGNSTPTIINDTQVVAGFANGKLVSLSLQDGKLLWEATISLPKGRTELERIIDIDGPVVYKNGVIYVSAYRGRVAAVDASSGDTLWTREMSSHLGVVVDDDLLFITDEAGRVWALNPETGATLWMQDKLAERATTSPAVYRDKLVIGDIGGELYWLDKRDGRLLGHLDYDQVSKFSGATLIGDELDGKEPEKEPTAVVFQPDVVAGNVLVTYQNGILASISTSN